MKATSFTVITDKATTIEAWNTTIQLRATRKILPIVSLFMAIGLGLAIFGITTASRLWQHWAMFSILLVNLAGCGITFWRLRSRNDAGAGKIIAAGLLILTLAVSFLYNNWLVVFGMLAIATILMGSILMSQRTGFLLTIFLFICGLGLFAILLAGLQLPAIDLPNEINYIAAILATILSTVMGILLVSTRQGGMRQAYEDLAETAEDILTRIQGLETEKAKLEGDLQKAQKPSQNIQFIREITQMSGQTANLDSLLSTATDMIYRHLNCYFCSLLLTDDQGEYAVMRAASGDAAPLFLQRGFKLRLSNLSLVTSAIQSGSHRLVNDVNADFAYQRHPLLPDTRAELVLPLRTQEKTIGALDLQSEQIGFFEQDDFNAMQVVADQLAMCIQNEQMARELERSTRETGLLYQRYTQETWSRMTRHQKRLGFEYNRSRTSPSEERISSEMLAEIKQGHAQITHSDDGVNSVLLAPLMMHGQIIGVIGIEEPATRREWTPDEIALVNAITTQTTLALDNARLLEETQLRSEQIRLLQEITSIAASSVQLKEVLVAISEKIRSGFNLLHCGIALLDPDKKRSTLVAYASAPGAPGSDLIGVKIPIEGNQTTQQVIRSRQALIIYDAPNNPATRPTHDFLRRAGTTTLVILPLISGAEVIGTIGLDIDDPKRRIDEDELRLLSQIGLQTAAAIEVARSFEQTERRAEREHLMAEITAKVRASTNVNTILQTALQELANALNVNKASIQLRSGQSMDNNGQQTS